MPHTIEWKPGQRFLFVCYGNTCRSPMAEGLARKLLGEGVRVESAGLAPIPAMATLHPAYLLRQPAQKRAGFSRQSLKSSAYFLATAVVACSSMWRPT